MTSPTRSALAATIALSLGALATPAAAQDFTISLHGHVNTVSAPLPAPFAGVAPGQNFHMTIGVVDAPTAGMDTVSYPVDFASTRLTIGGVTHPYPTNHAPAEVQFLNDLAFGADRMVLASMPWVGALALLRVDDPTSSAFDSLDLSQMMGLDIGQLNPGISFMNLISAPALVNIALDEIRFGDATAVASAALGDGTGAACPCGNAGSVAQGCANSTGAGGILSAFGSASMASDDLGFWADQLPANANAILFSGATGLNGTLGEPFGAGLRSPGGALRRLGLQAADAIGHAEWDGGLIAASGATAGTTHYYQVWYRDASSPCMGTSFNVTPAYAVTIEP